MRRRPLLLVTLVAAASAAAQELGARPLASVRDVLPHVCAAPDGSALAVVDERGGVARIVDAETGEVREAPLAGEVAAIALLPGGRGAWLGLVDGGVAHTAAGGDVRRFDGVAAGPVDGLAVLSGTVAWSSSKADRAGVLDARDGDARCAFEAPFGGYRRPRVHLSRDGRLLAHRARDERGGGRSVVVVRDAGTGAELGRAPCYVSHRGCEVAFGVGALFSAERVTAHRWQLRRLDLVTFESVVLDDDARGLHFVDLFASPSGRYLLEGDREEAGAALYDVREAGPAARRLLGSARGEQPVGFVAAHGERGELAVTTVPGGGGLRLWSVRDAKPVGVIEGAGRGVTAAGSLRGGRALWYAWSRRHPDDRDRLQRGVDVVQLDG